MIFDHAEMPCRSAIARLGSVAIRLSVVGSLAVADLAGCANGGNMFSGGIDKSDACGVQHRDFYESKNYYLNETLQGMVIGAFSGATLGAVGAAITGGNVGQGAAVGAGAGALTGAAAGYFNARAKEAHDQAQLTQSIYEDVRKAASQLDTVNTSFAALSQCRFEQSALIKAHYRQSTITRDQAASQLADQHSRFADEIETARKYGAKMSEQDQGFRFAATTLAKDDPDAQRAMSSPHRGHAAAPTGSATDYTVNTAANVRKGPDAKAERIVGLYPGAKVTSLAEPADGWRKIGFNGNEGYILDKFLNAPGAAAAPPPAVSAGPAPDSANRKVAIAENVTETIPEKREHYDKSVSDAEKNSAVAFNLDQATPPS